jgi:(E)-4-hydroxy-3-methylbut-2-enyl-diphosphate synthase
VTEAGTPKTGIIKSAIGIGTLLAEGIGDTFRVSLTADPVEEVRVAWEILKALQIRTRGVMLIACPTCGRTKIDLISLAEKVEKALEGVNKNIKVAVMGCEVNGPGEAREADIGIAAGKGQGILFIKGKPVKRLKEEELLPALLEEIEKL